jgi:antitoxin VapB
VNHVSDIIPPYLVNTLADSPVRHVSLFRNGANQAVRIPKEFELPGKQATMRRVGNRLIIDLVEPKHPRGSAAALVAALESMKDWEPVLEEFPDVDEGLLPLDDIVL